mgnify:FL=1|tara:strand:+ start:3999 stop:4205 length:207 start_codon:yes stop_codon:yes gene_type:complete
MLVDLEEKQIQLLILATNYYLDEKSFSRFINLKYETHEEEDKLDKDYKLLSDAQMKLYEAVQRYKKRG